MTRIADANDFATLALIEAIEALQLVKDQALPDLIKALPDYLSDPGFALNLRKSGTQLTSGEKARLGMSARAFMSKELLAQLTPQGLCTPLSAHEMTLQRASFSVSRYQALEQARLASPSFNVRRVCPSTTDCLQIDAWAEPEAFDPLPPRECGDSNYRTCRSTFIFRRKGRA